MHASLVSVSSPNLILVRTLLILYQTIMVIPIFTVVSVGICSAD